MPGVLSIEDRARIAARYEVFRSVVAVQRWWRRVKGIHEPLNSRTIKNCHQKLVERGSVLDKKKSGRARVSVTEENIARVRDVFTRSPKKSVRCASRETGLSSYAVHRILRKHISFKPWKPQYVHELFLDDCDRRMAFSEEFIQWYNEWPQLFDNILWSDEAVFHVGGFVNKHNCHYWAQHNPKMSVEKLQKRPKLTVWCGFTSSNVVGPFILRETMNGVRYLNMLREQVWPVISRWENAQSIIFMQDGAPPHYHQDVRSWLNRRFRNKWLGRGGPYEWPARSPDLTPCDFFLWGWSKEEVYRTMPRNLDELENRVREVLTNIPAHMLQAAVADVPRRLEKCAANTGVHVEL